MVKRTALKHFGHLQSGSVMAPVIQKSERSSGLSPVRSIIARTGMRGVQLAEQFAQHLLEVVVIVDVGKEFGISLRHTLPVATMVGGLIETVLNLLLDIVIQVVAFRLRVELGHSRISNRLD